MRVAILLFCSAFAFGQGASSVQSQAPANGGPQEKHESVNSQNNGFKKYGAELSPGAAIQKAAQAAVTNHPGDMNSVREYGALDVLSDTQGVDFGPYLQRLVQEVRENWFHLIPQSVSLEKGKLALEFAILKDGHVQGLRITATSGDPALDRPAYASITACDPFPPLPSAFTGPYLALRLRFYYNPDKKGRDGPAKSKSLPAHLNDKAPILPSASTPSKSGIAVSISSLGDIYVLAGGSKRVTATVTGTKEQTVQWSVTGSGCSTSPCGNITGDTYIAPTVQPSPPVVLLTATSKADSTAKATVNVHIVGPFPKLEN